MNGKKISPSLVGDEICFWTGTSEYYKNSTNSTMDAICCNYRLLKIIDLVTSGWWKIVNLLGGH